jgi:septal ring factor EnvC (AmiA/AmiB activator)
MSASGLSSDEILKKIQAKMAEQNEVIREQQVQIQEKDQKLKELEERMEALNNAESERNDMLVKLAQLVE